MKIRWKNTVIIPTANEKWLLFSCKYPAVFIISGSIISGFGFCFYKWLTDLENGKLNSVYVGNLKPLYSIFGKWGIVSFFIFIAFCGFYLFWIFAISKPKNKPIT